MKLAVSFNISAALSVSTIIVTLVFSGNIQINTFRVQREVEGEVVVPYR